jgi:archaeal flagellar protein FlaI
MEDLGWQVQDTPRTDILKVYRQHDSHAIIQHTDGRKRYMCEKIRPLTEGESQLLTQVIHNFRKEDQPATEKALYDALKEYCILHVIVLSNEQRILLLELFHKEIHGLSVLDYFLQDEELEEIVFFDHAIPITVYHRTFGWLESNVLLTHPHTVKDLVNRMARTLERRLSLHTPRINATLPDGSRLHATIPPVSLSAPTFTIRKFTKEPFLPTQLAASKTLSVSSLAFLWMAMELDCSALIVGNTGSGKTSTLNSILSFVPESERIIVTEETPEIVLPHRHTIKLNCVEHANIGMRDLITDTLRMRPDRVIVGEIRTEKECRAFIETMLAGQGKGSIATFHAQSAREAITRLHGLGVSELDLRALDMIVVQKRWNSYNERTQSFHEKRRILEIVEVRSSKNGIELYPLFLFDYRNDCLKQKGKSTRIAEKARNTFSFSHKLLEKELQKRKKWLENNESSSFSTFFFDIHRRHHETAHPIARN